MTKPPYRTLPNRTFGVEFELTIDIIPNLYNEQDICDMMMQGNGLPCQSAKYSDKDVKPYWKVKPDSSIACPWDRKRCFAYELVSPVLSGNGGLHQIYKQVEAMRPYKPSADYSSGFHVHVYIGKESKGNLKLENLKKILQNFIKYEQVFDSIMPRTRRGSINGYCQSIRNNSNLAELSNFAANNLIAKMTNFVDLNQLVNPGEGILFQRHFKLNLQPILTLGTIEWRQHATTANYEKASSWIRLILHFMEASIKNAPPKAFKENISLDVKFNRFFEWIIKDRRLYDYYKKRRSNLAKKKSFYDEKKQQFISPNSLTKMIYGPNDDGHHKGKKDGELDAWETIEARPCHDRLNANDDIRRLEALPKLLNEVPVIGILRWISRYLKFSFFYEKREILLASISQPFPISGLRRTHRHLAQSNRILPTRPRLRLNKLHKIHRIRRGQSLRNSPKNHP